MGPRPEKRAAILAAAQSVFGEAGYAGASTERIADLADVSTRTLYKHFASKTALFDAVLVEGAQEVGDAFDERVAAIDRDGDAEAVVRALGRALVGHRLDFPRHFAVTRHADLHRAALAPDTLAAWQRVGPSRVRSTVCDVLGALADRGALQVDDPGAVADQLVLLTAGAIAFAAPPPDVLTADDAEEVVDRATRTFLRGYGVSPQR